MKEIRLHGRGGHGVVKAGEILVWAAVRAGLYANSIPYFGFERRGAPVAAFVRIDEKPIREKTQVYQPNCIIVMDETLARTVPVFQGLRQGSVCVLNSRRCPEDISVPGEVSSVATVDATSISLNMIGRAIPNTVMLGAFVRATGWVPLELVVQRASEVFGAANAQMVRAGYDSVLVGRGRS